MESCGLCEYMGTHKNLLQHVRRNHKDKKDHVDNMDHVDKKDGVDNTDGEDEQQSAGVVPRLYPLEQLKTVLMDKLEEFINSNTVNLNLSISRKTYYSLDG